MGDRKERQNQTGNLNRSSGTDQANVNERLRKSENENNALPPGIAHVENTGAEGDAAEKIIDRDERNSNQIDSRP